MARRQIVTRVGRGVRRRTHWVEVNGATSVSTSIAVQLFTTAVGHEGETVVRVRGLGVATLETGNVASAGFFGAFGMAIVTTAASTIGVTAIPTPLTEAGWDGWLLHRYFEIERTGPGGGGAGEIDRLILDSKAMRKANEDESLVGVFEVILSGTAIMNFQVRARVLSMIG